MTIDDPGYAGRLMMALGKAQGALDDLGRSIRTRADIDHVVGDIQVRGNEFGAEYCTCLEAHYRGEGYAVFWLELCWNESDRDWRVRASVSTAPGIGEPPDLIDDDEAHCQGIADLEAAVAATVGWLEDQIRLARPR